MKKTLCFVFIVLFCVFTLLACNKNDDHDNNNHFHMYGKWVTVKEATCTVSGERERYCDCGEKETRTIDAFGHTEVIDVAVPATCTMDGKTEGTHCSVCNEIMIEPQIDVLLGHIYGEWSVKEYATDSKEGQRVRTCARCNTTEYGVIDIKSYNGSLGSAGKIAENTVIVSIFANDSDTSWDFNSDEDNETINIMHDYLSAAVEWLEKECKTYGADTEFTYDWTINSDLLYNYDFSHANMIRPDGGAYYIQRAYIEDNINSEEIKQKYNAQNIIYILYFNTDEQNTVNSWATPDMDVEVINAFVKNYDQYADWYYLPASSIAHEILHCFGAHDLYYASDAIPQEYVDYCNQTYSGDIMYTVNWGDRIYSEFTELCAYYVGLTDSCAEVEKWNLAKSQHINP